MRFIRERVTERGAVCLLITIPKRACSPGKLFLRKTTKNFPCRLAANAPVNCALPLSLALRGSRKRAGFRLPDVRVLWPGEH